VEWAEKQKQIPFGYAQGRLSTSLRFAQAAGGGPIPTGRHCDIFRHLCRLFRYTGMTNLFSI